jgi:hypothetical protein
MGTSVLDVTDPERPVLVSQWPAPAHSHTHKVQVAAGRRLVFATMAEARSVAAEAGAAPAPTWRY